MKKRIFRLIIVHAVTVLIISGMVLTGSVAAETKAGEQKEPVPVSNRQNIKAVYEVTKLEWEEGVGKGLATLQGILKLYQSMEVPLEELNLHAVFHSRAGAWMLTDEAYNEFTNGTGGNPNRDIIQELVNKGVGIELCSQTMKHNGWTKEDILPVVTIVVDAYSRLVDLQQDGFAYIRF